MTHTRLFAVAALAAGLVASTHAAITVSGSQPIRWGLTGGAIGFADGTVEDFEDATLAPGLQVEWLSPAGNFGPTSTLPNLFNATVADPFGNAFVGGNWDGTHACISAHENRTYNYFDGSNWGDVVFHFNPPVRAVGFSLHQMEGDTRIVINGTDRGSVSSLAALSPGSARIGYVLIQCEANDTISSVKLDNIGGDGFTVDHLKFSTATSPRFNVDGFGPQLWGSPDSVLGLSSFAIEDFEDTTLIPGLSIEWQTFAGNVGPTSTLPNTFNPVTDDNFGNAFDQGVWDGTRCVINTRDNQSHAYTGTGEWGDIIFHFNPPQSSIGFSLHQADADGRLVVNGRDVGSILGRTGLPLNGGNRQGYVRIDGLCPDTRIFEIRFNNNRSAIGGDGYAFDHLSFNRCIADIDDGSGSGDCDGGVTIDDLLFYLAAFEAGGLQADIDDGSSTGTPDGGVTIDDLLYYLIRFENGC